MKVKIGGITDNFEFLIETVGYTNPRCISTHVSA